MFIQRFDSPARLSPWKRARPFSLVFFCYALALLFGSACVKLPRRAAVVSGFTTTESTSTRAVMNAPPVNINSATRAELERLPGIGRELAARVVEHRERYGAFRRVEHLMLVRGISERRFENLRAHVSVD